MYTPEKVGRKKKVGIMCQKINYSSIFAESALFCAGSALFWPS